MKGKNVIVRSNQSGVWFGRLVSAVGTPDGYERVELAGARRIWSWEGAGSCSGLAAHGPRAGKIAPAVDAVVSGVCERLAAAPAAVKAFAAIPEWRP